MFVRFLSDQEAGVDSRKLEICHSGRLLVVVTYVVDFVRVRVSVNKVMMMSLSCRRRRPLVALLSLSLRISLFLSRSIVDVECGLRNDEAPKTEQPGPRSSESSAQTALCKWVPVFFFFLASTLDIMP